MEWICGICNWQMAGLRYQRWSLTSNRSPSSFIYRPQTKAWSVRTRCETCWRCSSKPDPPDLLQSSRRCPAITRLEACSRLTSHYMDPSDPPGHGNTGDWCSRAGRGQIVLATNRNGGMLRLIAPRHDDDEDDVLSWFHVRKDRYLSLPMKIRVYEILVLPILLYACETWTVLIADERRLEAFHMKCQR